MTTTIRGTDNTAASPALTGTDPDTGIFFPAADTIAFAEGGAEVMRINSSGYLLLNATSSTGVGVTRYQVGSTSSATSQVLLQGTSTHLSLYAAAAAEAYVSYAVGSALVFGNGPADGSTFTEQARITSGGDFRFNSGYGSVATAYGCRAWVNFNGTGTVAIRASGNVSSITDNGAGSYTVNFTNAMPDANYSTVISNVGFSATSTQRNSTIAGVFNSAATTYTTSAVRVATGNPSSASLEDNVVMCVSIFR